ncbi:MAG: dependent oxidoreductase [Actinomycetia bacterium]|nr:dependent oxidoreductase [Actinomycetes bacterium]
MAAGASVVVVGGGVMGCSIAFHLAERGVDTLVLERGTVCSGMTARSGALVRMHYTNEPEARMALAGLGYFREWRERVGGWCGFTVTGAAILVGPGEGERLRRNVAMLRRVGVDTEAVTPADLAAEHPELNLTGVEMAAVEPGSGYADPVATTFAFASRAVDLGARIGQGVAARGLAVAGDRVVGVDTDDGRVGADAVVLACGPWVDPLARTAGFELGITPERSQIAFFRRPEAARRHPVVIDGVLGTYFRPHGGELSLLGVEAGHHIGVSPGPRSPAATAASTTPRPTAGPCSTPPPGWPGCTWPAASPAPASRSRRRSGPAWPSWSPRAGPAPSTSARSASAASPTATPSWATSTACRRSSATSCDGNRSACPRSDHSGGPAVYTA